MGTYIFDSLTSPLIWVLSVLAVLSGALIAGMRKRAESDASSLGGFIAGALLFHPMRLLRGQASLYFAAFDYAKRQLKRPATKFLEVPARDDVSLETDKVFVPLTLEGQGKRYDHKSVLQVGNRLRIVGDPGSGKSTIIKRLLRDQCNLLARWQTAHRGCLPVIIELRNLKPPIEPDVDLGDWILNEVKKEAARFTAYDMKSCVASFVQGRGLLVLFDGADEIVAEHYDAVQTALNAVSERLAAESGENIVIITMRSQFHLQVRNSFARQYPSVLHVKAFTPSDIYALLNKWPFRSNSAGHAARIYADLSDRPSLRELCYNPLVLSMYVAEDQRRMRETEGATRNVQVPDSRTEFYGDVVDELLLKRREAQSGQQTAARVTVRRQREQFFGGLAYHHLLNASQAANAIPFADAVALVKDVYAVSDLDRDVEDEEAKRILRELSSQTGLFSEERKGEQLRFIHLSFIEYFAALLAIERVEDGWRQLLNRHQVNQLSGETSLTTRLREVFPFAVYFAREKEREGYLADVCEKLQDDQLKASCFLETKAYQSRAWRGFAHGLPPALRSLLPQLENEADAQTFYTFVAALRDAEAHGYGTPSDATDKLDDVLRAILQADEALAIRAVELMAGYDAVAALRLAELCRLPLLKEHPWFLIKNAEQPAFLAQIIQRALTKQDDRDAWLVYAGMSACWMPPARAALLTQEPIAGFDLGDSSVERFWSQLCEKKGRSLLTQILGCISTRATELDRFKEHLPYTVWQFVVNGLVREYLIPAGRRANVRIILGVTISFFAVLTVSAGIVGVAAALGALVNMAGILEATGIEDRRIIAAITSFSPLLVAMAVVASVVLLIPRGSITEIMRRNMFGFHYGSRSFAIMECLKGSDASDRRGRGIVVAMSDQKCPRDLYFRKKVGRREARVCLTIRRFFQFKAAS